MVRGLCVALVGGRMMAHRGMTMTALGMRRRCFVVVDMERGRSGCLGGAVRRTARRHRVHGVALQRQCHGKKPSQDDAKQTASHGNSLCQRVGRPRGRGDALIRSPWRRARNPRPRRRGSTVHLATVARSSAFRTRHRGRRAPLGQGMARSDEPVRACLRPSLHEIRRVICGPDQTSEPRPSGIIGVRSEQRLAHRNPDRP